MYGGSAGGLHASHSSGRARAKVAVGSWAPMGGWGCCFSFPTAKNVFARMALHIPSSAHVHVTNGTALRRLCCARVLGTHATLRCRVLA